MQNLKRWDLSLYDHIRDRELVRESFSSSIRGIEHIIESNLSWKNELGITHISGLLYEYHISEDKVLSKKPILNIEWYYSYKVAKEVRLTQYYDTDNGETYKRIRDIFDNEGYDIIENEK